MKEIVIHSNGNNFAIIKKEIINADYLSLEARMLMIKLIALDTYTFTFDFDFLRNLIKSKKNGKIKPIGITKLKQVLKELKENHYLIVSQKKGEDGRFIEDSFYALFDDNFNSNINEV